MESQSSAPLFPELATQVREGRYFYLHRRRVAADPVVVCGGRESCGPDYAIDRSDFPFFAIEWVERGQGDLWLAGRHYELGPATVFCYGPGIPCRIQSNSENPLVKCFLDARRGPSASMPAYWVPRPGVVTRVASPAELSEVFDGLHREAVRRSRESQAFAAIYLRLLCLKIRAGRSPAPAAGSARHDTFLRCRQSLRDHFRDHLSVESAAGRLGVTPSYLCRLFRENGEISPYQYLLRLRMNHALDLVLASGGLIKQASYSCGFRDPSHFSRLFKQVHGLTPRELLARSGRGSGREPQARISTNDPDSD